MSGGQWMIVLIVLIAVLGSVLKKGPRHDRRIGTAGDDGEARALRDEVRQLKDRIHVLERVITDNHGSIGLEREIDKLRDR